MPCYSQLKFTKMSADITRSTTAVLPGLICALSNGLLWVCAAPLLDHLPRFYLGGLLVYAGLGFTLDNLWSARTRVAREEFAAIWVIFLVNIALGFFIAVVTGFVLGAIIFVLAYQRIGVVKVVMEGSDYESNPVGLQIVAPATFKS